MNRFISVFSGWLKGHWRARLAAAASGTLVALAFPHFDLWPLAWFAFVPLLLVLPQRTGWQRFRLALLAGTAANFVGFFWMVNMLHQFGHLPYAPSVAIIFVGSIYQGLSIAVAFAAGLAFCGRTRWPLWLVLPIVYTGLEAFHPILFPWFLGNCQYQLLPLIQVCDLFGVSVLTTLLVMGNCVLADLIRLFRLGKKRPAIREWVTGPAVFATLLVLVLAYGAIRLGQVSTRQAEADHLTLGVVEPEIGIFEEQLRSYPEGTSGLSLLKWNLLNLHRTSRELAKEDIDLLIWPESTYFPALSTYARQWTNRYVGGGTSLSRLPDSQATILEDRELLGGASAGEHLTFLVGTEGTLLKVGKMSFDIEPPPPGTTADLHDAWVACQRSVELKDTSADQCFALAVGDGGAILVRTPESWVRLESDVAGDWRAVASSGLTDLLVGGEHRVAAGTLTNGLTMSQPTPEDRWLAGVRLDGKATLVSDRGALAILTDARAIHRQGPPSNLDGTVRDATTAGSSRLLLATSRGLYMLAGRDLTHLFGQSGVRQVACAADNDCLFRTDDNRWWHLEPVGQTVTEQSLEAAPVNTLVGIPFGRHYWWLPADATALYTSSSGLPVPHAFPAAVENDTLTPVADRNAVQRGFGVPLLFGATSGNLLDLEDPNSLDNTRYNSAFLVDGNGTVLGRYDKQYLLAFGEYIPLGDLFPILYQWSPDSGRFAPGPARAPLEFLGHRLGVLICYEDIIPAHTNAIVGQGVDVLLNLTNDAWFGKTKEPYQHFVLAAFRAVEQRRALVRATTTGISGVVQATGEITKMTDLYDAETFVADVPLLQETTVYAMGGRHFSLVCLLFALGILGWGLWRRITGSRSGQRRSATAEPSPRT